ncbi:MAG: CPBP family intramembrane metalloprotease [Treponema sp.]|nr:CPBP family intramembrane metalloprotease [Treponema sp.]
MFSAGNVDQFTAGRELNRIFGYSIPSLLLLWYLFHIKGKRIFPLRAQFGDFQSLIIALPGLLGIGLGISVLSSIIPLSETTFAVVQAPGEPAAWILMIFSCFSTGYLEETYFRHYLLNPFRKQKPGTQTAGPENPDRETEEAFFPDTRPGRHGLPAAAGALYAKAGPIPGILVSTALFSLCHIYEGPWGVINAVLAGLLLSLIYVHYGALHGLAWAHGLYNIFIYANGV